MAVCTWPPSLQDLSQAAASTWLLEWAGLAGRVATRPAASDTRQGSLVHPRPHTLDGSTAHLNTRVNDHKLAQAANPVRSTALECKWKLTNTNRLFSLSKTGKETKARHKEEIVLPKVPNNSLKCSEDLFHRHYELLAELPRRQVCKFPGNMNTRCLQLNTERCSQYLRSHLPPLQLESIMEDTWARVRQRVAAGGLGETAPHYQVVDWARTAPVILSLAALLSNRKYTLDVSGVSQVDLQNTLSVIRKSFPLRRINKLQLPKIKYKTAKQVLPICSNIVEEIIGNTCLVSLSIGSNISSDNIIGVISQLSLQELKMDVNVSSSGEERVIRELCDLPLCTANDIVNAVTTGDFWTFEICPLRKSLRNLEINIPGVSGSVYYIFPLVFTNLRHYHPNTNIVSCIIKCARILQRATCDHEPPIKPLANIVRVHLGRATVSEIREVSRACPAVEEISLIAELHEEETLNALESFEHLTAFDISYFPASPSSLPKQDGRLLLPVLSYFKDQLQSLSLTGFNLTGSVVHSFSQLPELKTLQLADSWLSSPRVMPDQPFRSLENLTLKLLPSDSMMELLTAGSCLVNLAFEFVASEWEGNALTDGHVTQLVTSGRLSSVQSFSAKSPFLTLASLKVLSLLPYLKRVGRLALWGLTEDELHCVTHSGPSHILCIR